MSASAILITLNFDGQAAGWEKAKQFPIADAVGPGKVAGRVLLRPALARYVFSGYGAARRLSDSVVAVGVRPHPQSPRAAASGPAPAREPHRPSRRRLAGPRGCPPGLRGAGSPA